MLKDVSNLKAAYDFYQKCKKESARAVSTGAYNDAFIWVFAELDELFADEDED